jgi:hypothetical protein
MPRTSVVMVTMHENPDYLFEAVKAGAAGYVLKDASGERLLGAVTASVIMIEPTYHTHTGVQEIPVLWLRLSSDGGVRSRFHASTLVPGSMILNDAVGGRWRGSRL